MYVYEHFRAKHETTYEQVHTLTGNQISCCLLEEHHGKPIQKGLRKQGKAPGGAAIRKAGRGRASYQAGSGRVERGGRGWGARLGCGSNFATDLKNQANIMQKPQ